MNISGRPLYSTGCYACRRMKVKCDEAKPGCARCSRGKRTCPGYRDASEMMFRNMDSASVPKASKRCERHPRQSLVPRANYTESAIPTPILSKNWEQHALAYFFENYVLDSTASGGGHFHFLPELYRRSSDDSCLKESVKAISMTCLANISSMDYLSVRSQRHYGRALRITRIALNTEAGARSEQVLTAIVLLQSLEAINGLPTGSRDPHDEGLAQLLRMRGPFQADSSIGQSIHRGYLVRRFIRDLDGTFPLSYHDDPGVQLLSPAHRRLNLVHLLSRVAHSCRQIKFISRHGLDPSNPEIDQLLQDATLLDSELVAWKKDVPANQQYRSYELSECQNGDVEMFPTQVHVFHDLQHGALWLGYWCACMHLLSTLIQTMTLRHSSLDRLPEISQCKIQARLLEVVDDTCGSVPYMLGEVDETGGIHVGAPGMALGAFFVQHGLQVAKLSPNVPIAQQQWIQERLLHIAHVRGIKAALKPKSNTMWVA